VRSGQQFDGRVLDGDQTVRIMANRLIDEPTSYGYSETDHNQMVHSHMRMALIVISGFALVLFALCEVVLAAPVAWWLYLSLAVMFVVAFVHKAPIRHQPVRISALVSLLGIVALLYLVDWNTRKPFLRDLARIHVGMTEGEVRQIMGHYIEGTGWPASPFDNATNPTGTLTDLSSGAKYSAAVSPSGELVIRDSLTFRHSNDGAFNSDWGIVSLSRGKVVKVEFSPD